MNYRSLPKGWIYLYLNLLLLSGTSIASIPMPAAHSTSFELIKGIILVQAEMDGETANFILDTGSPMMILNGQTTQPSENQANTPLGNLSGEWKTIDQFSWAGIHKFNMNALTMDISHLEQMTEKPIKGLIGYEFFGGYDLMLDFENQVIALVAPNYIDKQNDWKLVKQLSIDLEGHLPVIDANIGKMKVRLGLDTGSSTNLLDLRIKDEISQELIAESKEIKVVGLNAQVQKIQSGYIQDTKVAGINYSNMQYLFIDISSLKNLKDNDVDGLLGFPFFKSGKFTINYNQKLIKFWE